MVDGKEIRMISPYMERQSTKWEVVSYTRPIVVVSTSFFFHLTTNIKHILRNFSGYNI